MELTPVLDGISSGGALGVAALVIWALIAGQLYTKSAVDDLRQQLRDANQELAHREHERVSERSQRRGR